MFEIFVTIRDEGWCQVVVIAEIWAKAGMMMMIVFYAPKRHKAELYCYRMNTWCVSAGWAAIFFAAL